VGGEIILVLGGARSGKSRFAQEMADGLSGRVLFVATAEAGDEEMRVRIENHKRSRPADWRTLEAPTKVGAALAAQLGDAEVVIIDCLTLLVSNLMIGAGDEGQQAARVAAEVEGLLDCLEQHEVTTIIVSNEVGLGLVPDNSLGRSYRDLLGRANQTLAQRADTVYFMVAGIPLVVKGAKGGNPGASRA
jgi:adenosylcobinamide kinase/adenosylcobinamide-phosphate guanylyltransferase